MTIIIELFIIISMTIIIGLILILAKNRNEKMKEIELIFNLTCTMLYLIATSIPCVSKTN